MTISSRTPEGLPSHCPLCGAKTNVEYSNSGGDATCPNCGCLLWAATQILQSFTRQLESSLNAAPGSFSGETELSNIFEDSLDSIEFVIELQEEFGVTVPDELAADFRTIGDVIRYIESRRRDDFPT